MSISGQRFGSFFLVKKYAGDSKNFVFATSRSAETPESTQNISYISGIDVASESAGATLVSHLKAAKRSPDTVIITAGYFGTESFDEPKWADEIKMYTTSAVGPVFLVHHLIKAGLMQEGSKIMLVSSESGREHHLEARERRRRDTAELGPEGKGIAVGIVHPGFMRTEMTQGVGFDKFWEEGGAVRPDEAAASLIDFIDKLA
ncbi:MAG: hypothetical protein FRX48_01969 [Lasallia pustulata]|uniref:Uncharacterized protein n=1 Tax=Lasallia pustulata TaxID=136370 RepID=A0A5M8Q2P6_9LECA|nr:MAG: hypothetical protein FRX48_01969 [Lasallia pustulata]